jgi:toxoflavin biosynthesis protein ToxD
MPPREAVGGSSDAVTPALRDVVINGEINELSDRDAMGLPAHYVPPELVPARSTLDAIRAEPLERLVQLAQSVAAELPVRLAAGHLLGWLGDPRLDPLKPCMVDIPGGNALLGVQPERVTAIYECYRRYGVRRDWIEKECPRFTVKLAAFRLAKYPVTNGDFAVFLEDTQYPHLPTAWRFGRIPEGQLNHPVYTVTPAMADAYVEWLAKKTGRSFRLPTEYEWEYAAAGADGREFPWGPDFLDRHANTMELRLLGTTPVGVFPEGASPFGVLDMAGNVEEYVSTSYHAYPGWHIVQDDLFRQLGHYRVARGGAFNRFRDLARCQRRHGPYPKSLYAIGLRVAESLAHGA